MPSLRPPAASHVILPSPLSSSLGLGHSATLFFIVMIISSSISGNSTMIFRIWLWNQRKANKMALKLQSRRKDCCSRSRLFLRSFLLSYWKLNFTKNLMISLCSDGWDSTYPPLFSCLSVAVVVCFSLPFYCFLILQINADNLGAFHRWGDYLSIGSWDQGHNLDSTQSFKDSL